VLAGSSGESATLSVEEKGMLVKRAREIADAHGKTDFTVTPGSLD
jgi:4-hydroxy-2-oxoglutarate aldolase